VAEHGGGRDPRPARQQRHCGVQPFQPYGDAEFPAEGGQQPRSSPGTGQHGRPERRERGVRVPSQAGDGQRRAQGRKLAPVPPYTPADDHEGEFGERVTGVDDHHGLHARAPRPPGVPAHLPVAAHGASRWSWEGS